MMAEADPDAIGYDINMFLDEKEMKNYLCGICLGVVRNGVICPEGPHRFCKNCVRRWLDTTKTCPACRRYIKLREYTADVFANSVLKKALVKCPNGEETETCDWRGPFDSLKFHEGHCLYTDVSCEHCGAIMMRCRYHHHLSKCPKMPAQPCEACNATMLREKLDEHCRLLCTETEVSCPLKCQKVMARKEVLRHVLEDCQERLHSCPFPGCAEVVNDIRAHNKDFGRYHAFLLMQLQLQFKTPPRPEFIGQVHSFLFTVEDVTRTVQSNSVSTGQHEFKIFMLPSDRDVRKDVGIFLKLITGTPTVINVRVKMNYGSISSRREGRMSFNTGELKGWSQALLTDQMDMEERTTKLEMTWLIQHMS